MSGADYAYELQDEVAKRRLVFTRIRLNDRAYIKIKVSTIAQF